MFNTSALPHRILAAKRLKMEMWTIRFECLRLSLGQAMHAENIYHLLRYLSTSSSLTSILVSFCFSFHYFVKCVYPVSQKKSQYERADNMRAFVPALVVVLAPIFFAAKVDAEICAENQYASGGACVACPAGTTNVAGDKTEAGDTTCDATLCAVNEYVSSNACVACPAGTTNAAGDDASGPDTVCDGCGTGVKDGAEVCDGADLGSATCVTQGYTTGTLACASDCTSFDTSNCFGESTTLAGAQAAAGTAKTTLDDYFAKRSAKLIAEHNRDVAIAACADATEAATEAAALTTEATNVYNQAVKQEAALGDGAGGAYNAAVAASTADDDTPADKTWKLLNAKTAWDQAVAEMNSASEVKTAAESASGTAEGTKSTKCDLVPGLNTTATQAGTAYGNAKTAVENDDNIPTINPATLDFIYEDLDGDLIPNRFDACPTQMGLRKNSPANPGPQDFCPSGCPELLDTDGNPVDSDLDGIPDCEDRCPFEGSDGIPYNHGDHLTTVSGFSLAWNGCKDSDGDGIPDKFDACPDQDGGACTSGCPDPGNDRDSDLDGVIDCADRCPNTYAVGTADGCPDLDMDGVPDSIDYCMATPGAASFAFTRTLELDDNDDPVAKDLTIMGCPDADADLVPDAVDLCDAPSYPNQGPVVDGVKTSGVAVVDKSGCPLDLDNDSVFDGYDKCDATVHSPADTKHDPNAIVYTEEDAGGDASLLGCPKDTDNDGIVDGIDQVRIVALLLCLVCTQNSIFISHL